MGSVLGRRRRACALAIAAVVAATAAVAGATLDVTPADAAGARLGSGTQATASADDTEAVSLDVVVGIAGEIVPMRRVPVVVTVHAKRLVKGELVLRPAAFGGPQTFSASVPVEVAANSSKTYTLVVPTSPWADPSSVAVEATLRVGGTTLVTGSGQAQVRSDEELVGLLGSIASDKAIPETTNLTVPLGIARFVPLNDDLMRTAGALDPIDQLAATPTDLDALSEVQRANVVDWIRTGGRLLVAAGDDANPAMLPASWQPPPVSTPRRAVLPTVAGSGQVARVDPKASWWSTVAPSGFRSTQEDLVASMKGFGGFPVSSAVANEVGLQAARIAWLGAFLASYVVIAGLVVPIVLRRLRRPGWLWVALPVLALAFTIGAWVAGRTLHGTSRSGYVSVAVTDAAGSQAETWLGVVSKSGGTERASLPAGWTASQPQLVGNEQPTQEQSLTAKGVELSTRLAAGGFGVLQANGPVPWKGALEVKARSAENGKVSIEIRNATPYLLEKVGVFVDQAAVKVDSIGPGDTKKVELSGTDRTGFDGQPAGMSVWPESVGFNGPPDLKSIAVPTAVEEVVRREGGWSSPGLVRAVGWTRDAPSPLTAATSAKGRTAVVGLGYVEPVDRLTDVSVRRRTVRGPGVNQGFGPGTVIVYAYDVGDATDLVVRAPAATSTVEVLVGARWVEVPIGSAAGSSSDGSASDGGSTTTAAPLPPSAVAPAATIAVGFGPAGFGPDGGPVSEVALPPGATVDGRVYLRATSVNNPFALAGLYVTQASTR